MGHVTRRGAMRLLGGAAAAGLSGLSIQLQGVGQGLASPGRPQPPARNKRDLMLGFLDGHGPANYVPAAFFLHFDPQFHRGQAAVDKHLEYFRATDMDFVKIQYELTFPPRPQITRAADWARMPLYREDFYAPQIEILKGLVKEAKRDALIVMTVYSPFMCAGHTSEAVTRHLMEDPESVKKGLDIITESLLIFVKACTKAGVDGFYASTQGGEAKRFADPRFFRDYIKPADLVLMSEMRRSSVLHITHVCDYVDAYADVAPFLDYPGHVVNSPLTFGTKRFTPTELSAVFKRPFMGGLERHGILATGSPAEVTRATRALLSEAPERFILGADCTVPSDIPWSHLKTAIAVAHGTA